MPKSLFANGQKVTSAWRNAMQDLVFDDLDIDGHYPRLLDDSLSNAPGNIRADFRLFADALKVTYPGTGLTVNIAAGAVTLPNGLAATVAATSHTLPANQISFLWVDSAGVVQFGLDLPVRSVPIARFEATATGMAVNGLTDLRSRFTVGPQSRAIRVYGGQATNNILIGANTTLGGRVYCRNFTLQAGSVISVPSGYLEIIASGSVTIAGTINVSAPVAGGYGFSGAVVPGYYYAESGRGLGGGGGHNSAALPVYNWAAGPFGSGGASGFGYAASGVAGSISASRGGFGGGAFIVDAALAVSVSGAINCAGTAGLIGTIAGGSGTIALPGGGGGSGGLIRLASLTSVTATAAAQLNVQGGAGAAGTSINYAPSSAYGGGGGGGGWLVCQAPSVNLTGATVLLNGGFAGANFGTAAGIAGSVGASYGGAAGVGGTAPTAGSIGQQVVELFTPV